MNEEQLETIGLLVDKAENYLAGLVLPLPSEMKVDALKLGLTEIRDELKKFYLDNGGEDVWA